MKRFIKNYWFLVLVAGLVIIIDQITKYYVRQNLGLGEMWAPWDWMIPYARILHWHNTGVAFGLFQDGGIIYLILPLIISVAVFVYFPKVEKHEWLMRIGLGMQLGGALGNWIDRIVNDGRVTDFISVGQFPVWNLADTGITVGTGLLLLGIWLQERREKKLKEENIQQIEMDEILE